MNWLPPRTNMDYKTQMNWLPPRTKVTLIDTVSLPELFEMYLSRKEKRPVLDRAIARKLAVKKVIEAAKQ